MFHLCSSWLTIYQCLWDETWTWTECNIYTTLCYVTHFPPQISTYQDESKPPALLRSSQQSVITKLIFGPVEEQYDYIQRLIVDISHDLGAFTRIYLSIRVSQLCFYGCHSTADFLNLCLHIDILYFRIEFSITKGYLVYDIFRCIYVMTPV